MTVINEAFDDITEDGYKTFFAEVYKMMVNTHHDITDNEKRHIFETLRLTAMALTHFNEYNVEVMNDTDDEYNYMFGTCLLMEDSTMCGMMFDIMLEEFEDDADY